LYTLLDSIGGTQYSQRGLWEKLLVPRGKRKAGEARQAGARGFWVRTREAKGRTARATEVILEGLKGLKGWEEKNGKRGEFK
jgi:hypothetical protein